MKKFIEKIKNYFSAKDLDVYDDLPIEEQYYRLRIRSIKEAEKNSRFFLVVLVVLLIFLLVAIVVASFADTGETASAVTASAEEEVSTNEAYYNNYVITLDRAPLHFFIPYNTYQTLSPAITVYFKDNILYYQQNSSYDYVGSMFFVYQVVDDLGNIYYEEVCRAGGTLNTAINSNGQYYINGNSFVGAHFAGSVALWYSPDTGGKVFYPLYTPSSAYPFNIYISSSQALDLNNIKIRSCALHDLHVYGSEEDRIWATYNFVNEASTSHRDLRFVGVTTTGSSSPLYPIKQSPDAQYNLGYNDGYNYGFDSGSTSGYERGYGEGSTIGYENGYNTGFDRGKIEGASNANDYSFLSLASSVFDAPIALIVGSMQDTNGDGIADTRVGGLLNFDLLGVNIASFLLAVFTVCVIIALVKLFISR